jgi:hypothetical protein
MLPCIPQYHKNFLKEGKNICMVAYTQQGLISPSSGGWNPRSRCHQLPCLMGVCSSQGMPSHYILTWWKGPLYEGTNAIPKGSDLFTSQGPHLLIATPWELNFNMRGMQTSRLQQCERWKARFSLYKHKDFQQSKWGFAVTSIKKGKRYSSGSNSQEVHVCTRKDYTDRVNKILFPSDPRQRGLLTTRKKSVSKEATITHWSCGNSGKGRKSERLG